MSQWKFETMFDEDLGDEPSRHRDYEGALKAALRFIAEALTWKTLALEGEESNGYIAIHLDGQKHPVAWLTEENKDA